MQGNECPRSHARPIPAFSGSGVGLESLAGGSYVSPLSVLAELAENCTRISFEIALSLRLRSGKLSTHSMRQGGFS